jgi:hypothetical protein
MASGSATRTGITFRITSRPSFVEKTGSVACTDDCGILIARCSTEPLPAGSYRFRARGRQRGARPPVRDAVGLLRTALSCY